MILWNACSNGRLVSNCIRQAVLSCSTEIAITIINHCSSLTIRATAVDNDNYVRCWHCLRLTDCLYYVTTNGSRIDSCGSRMFTRSQPCFWYLLCFSHEITFSLKCPRDEFIWHGEVFQGGQRLGVIPRPYGMEELVDPIPDFSTFGIKSYFMYF